MYVYLHRMYTECKWYICALGNSLDDLKEIVEFFKTLILVRGVFMRNAVIECLLWGEVLKVWSNWLSVQLTLYGSVDQFIVQHLLCTPWRHKSTANMNYAVGLKSVARNEIIVTELRELCVCMSVEVSFESAYNYKGWNFKARGVLELKINFTVGPLQRFRVSYKPSCCNY